LHAAHTDDEEQIVDGLRDHLHCTLTEQDAQAQPDARAQSTDQRGFAQHHAEDLLAGVAETAQRAEHGAALDDGKGHGVVNEKDADHERQQAERGQVDAEGGGHDVDLVVARGGGDEQIACGERGCKCGGVVAFGQDQVNLGEFCLLCPVRLWAVAMSVMISVSSARRAKSLEGSSKPTR
jgi:hypothetical protein